MITMPSYSAYINIKPYYAVLLSFIPIHFNTIRCPVRALVTLYGMSKRNQFMSSLVAALKHS